MAQLVEQDLAKIQVAGSSPAIRLSGSTFSFPKVNLGRPLFYVKRRSE